MAKHLLWPIYKLVIQNLLQSPWLHWFTMPPIGCWTEFPVITIALPIERTKGSWESVKEVCEFAVAIRIASGFSGILPCTSLTVDAINVESPSINLLKPPETLFLFLLHSVLFSWHWNKIGAARNGNAKVALGLPRLVVNLWSTYYYYSQIYFNTLLLSRKCPYCQRDPSSLALTFLRYSFKAMRCCIDVRASENQGFSRIAFVSCIIQRRSQDVEMRRRGFTGVGYFHAVSLRNTSTYISVWFKKSADSDAIVPSNTSWLRDAAVRVCRLCVCCHRRRPWRHSAFYV
jgi:hypothetical protein